MIFAKWDVTGRCNLQCKHCSVGQIYQLGEKKFCDLNTDSMLKIIEKLIAGNVTHIQVLGGEPFIRDDIFLILKKLSEAEINILINTNGHLLNEKKINKLIELGIETINFSFDGYNKETNDLVRGKNAFNATLKNLLITQNMVKESRTEMNVGINFVLTQHTIENSQKLIDFCEKNNIKNLAVNDLWITQNAEENQKEIALTGIDQKLKYHDELCSYLVETDISLRSELLPLTSGYLNYKHGTKFPTVHKCAAAERVIYIQADGIVYPCIKCRDDGDMVFEFSKEIAEDIKIKWSLLENDLNTIMNSKYFNIFREFNKVNVKDKEVCEDCIYDEYCNPCPFDYRRENSVEECEYVDKLISKL